MERFRLFVIQKIARVKDFSKIFRLDRTIRFSPCSKSYFETNKIRHLTSLLNRTLLEFVELDWQSP